MSIKAVHLPTTLENLLNKNHRYNPFPRISVAEACQGVLFVAVGMS